MRAMPRLRSRRFGRGAALIGAVTAATVGLSMSPAFAATLVANPDPGPGNSPVQVGPLNDFSTNVNVLSNDTIDGELVTFDQVTASLAGADGEGIVDTGRGFASFEGDPGLLSYVAYDPDDPENPDGVPDPSALEPCVTVYDTVEYTLQETANPENTTTGVVTISLPTTIVDIYAYDDEVNGPVDAPIDVHVLTNDCDQAGNTPADPANVEAYVDMADDVPHAQHGEVVDNLDGTFTYIPDAGFVGTDVFSYIIATLDDGERRISCAKVTVTVTDKTTPPTTTTPTTAPPTTTPPTSAAPALAATGSDSTIPLVITGGALLLVGAGFAVFARRRKGSAEHQ